MTAKTFDFTYTEGYWVRSFRVITRYDNEDSVSGWVTDSVMIWNNGVRHIPVDVEEFEGIEECLIWAFENRKRRKDERDICVEVIKTAWQDDNPYSDFPHGLGVNPYQLFEIWMCNCFCFGRFRYGTLKDKMEVVWWTKDRTNSDKRRNFNLHY